MKNSQEGRYELHLTFGSEVRLTGWKESAIDGDANLGNGVKYYLTTYASSLSAAKEKLDIAVKDLRNKGSIPLRAKIEYIVLDQLF